MKQNWGKIFIDGKAVKASTAQNIGIIIEEPGFIENMSGFRNLKLLASIRNEIDDDQIREAMRQVGLDSESRKHVGKYSLGMRHRLGIAQEIMEDPELLVLDEPMNGLDKQGVEEIRKLFLRFEKRKRQLFCPLIMLKILNCCVTRYVKWMGVYLHG